MSVALAMALPLGLRNRLAAVILAAVHDGVAREVLGRLAGDAGVGASWLEPAEFVHADVVRERAQRALDALGGRPLDQARSLADGLEVAALLFDAGLYFETHEVLEPWWREAAGAVREALQGLIQVAVGYEHRDNGNLAGARALLAEGSLRLHGTTLGGLDLSALAQAAAEDAERAAVGPAAGPGRRVAFPRPRPAR